MLIAQITDLHILPAGQVAYGVVDTSTHLERCVAHLNALAPRPDLVLITGDLVDDGKAEGYLELRALLEPLQPPCFLIPGNHDDRALIREAFPNHSYLHNRGEFIQYTVEEHPVRLIALDTLLPGEGGGLLCEARLTWLATRLAERPTVIFMHHPPHATGIAFMDRIGLQNAEGLRRVVAGHRRVERILCGHVHRPIQTLWAGTMVSCAPSPAHQVLLHLGEERKRYFIMDPPACHLHLWRPEIGLITHLSFIGEYDGPYSFRPEAQVGV